MLSPPTMPSISLSQQVLALSNKTLGPPFSQGLRKNKTGETQGAADE